MHVRVNFLPGQSRPKLIGRGPCVGFPAPLKDPMTPRAHSKKRFPASQRPPRASEQGPQASEQGPQSDAFDVRPPGANAHHLDSTPPRTCSWAGGNVAPGQSRVYSETDWFYCETGPFYNRTASFYSRTCLFYYRTGPLYSRTDSFDCRAGFLYGRTAQRGVVRAHSTVKRPAPDYNLDCLHFRV